MPTPDELNNFREAAVDMAVEAGKLTIRYFRTQYDIELKEDGSPVTSADRNAEELLRDYISNTFPDHEILGEEKGLKETGSPYRWILDPIDGTQSFIHGVPLYTTLVGLTYHDHPIAGVIYAPAVQELCDAAEGQGCRFDSQDCSIRYCESLDEATLLSTDITTIQSEGLMPAFEKMLHQCRMHRTWGDAYGHMLVASGRADIMFDPVLNVWDAAPLYTIVREAGGIYSDFIGESTIFGSNGLSCSPLLHGRIMEILNSK